MQPAKMASLLLAAFSLFLVSANGATTSTLKCELLLKNLSGNQVVLIGEVHSDPVHTQTKQALLESALRGEFFLGVEGATEDESEAVMAGAERSTGVGRVSGAQIRGLEHPAVHSFVGVTKAYIGMSRAQYSGDSVAELSRRILNAILLPIFERYSPARKAWLHHRIRHTNENLDPSEDGRFLDRLDGFVAALERGQHPSRKPLLQFDRFFYAGALEISLFSFAKSYVDYLVAALSKDLGLTPGFRRTAENVLLGFEDGTDPLVVTWRNKYLAQNIAAMANDAKERGKPLVVIMGNAHLRGLKALLKKCLPPRTTLRVVRQKETEEAFGW